MRNAGPSAVSAAYVIASFSFDAGRRGSAALCAYTTSPVSRSTTTAPDAEKFTKGRCSACERRVGREPVAAPAPAAATAATTQRAARKRASTRRFIVWAGIRVVKGYGPH